MTRLAKLRGLYFLPLFLLALLFQTPGTTTHAQSMYGPLNLYSDIYWGTDGSVYATSQVVPSIYHYTHQYKANVKITAPNGATVTNVSPWSYNSAYTSTSFDFAGVYLDGVFINDSDGVGWCGVASSVFATIVRALQTQVPAWVRLASFDNFTPPSISSAGSSTIRISYTNSGSAVGKSFTLSFGWGLGGALMQEDVSVSGGGSVTVSGPGNVQATYTVSTTRVGTIKAAVNAYSGSGSGGATVIGDAYKESSSQLSVNGG